MDFYSFISWYTWDQNSLYCKQFHVKQRIDSQSYYYIMEYLKLRMRINKKNNSLFERMDEWN